MKQIKIENNMGGITLIALVITIIIMLILAGIVLTMTIGENGIITRAVEASKKYKNAVVDENTELAKLEGNYIDNSREQITIDKAEYEQLKKDVETLKNNIETLKNETISNQRVNLINAPVEVPTSTTQTDRNISVSLNDSVEKYKYLEIQYIVNGNMYGTTQFIDLDSLTYNDSDSLTDNSSSIICQINCKTFYTMFICWLKDDKTLFIGDSLATHSTYKKIVIKNIRGIK